MLQLLGRCIKDLPREEIFVATKVGKYIPGQDEDFSAERVTKSVHESLKRMQLDYIDLIHCHDIESAKDMKQVGCVALPLSAFAFPMYHALRPISAIPSHTNLSSEDGSWCRGSDDRLFTPS